VTRLRYLLIVLLAGSIWGVSEAVLGGHLYSQQVPCSSIILSVVGLCILALTRFLVPVRGSSLVLVAVALGYRWLNVGFYGCHLGAMLSFAGVFEILASGIGAERLKGRVSQLLLGAGTGVLGFGLFALAMAYVVRYPFWVGAPMKVADHFLSGLAVGGAGLFLVPAMYRLSRPLDSWARSAVLARPLASLGLGAVVLLVFWIGF
jgi:hypothetical protein